MFSPEGHIKLTPKKLLELAQTSPRSLVNDYLLVGTPEAFHSYESYCAFRRTLAEKLQVHPIAITIRGSARLGFSPSPKRDKAWLPFRTNPRPSDIDVAIADVDYFNRLDADIRQWEARQRVPHYSSRDYASYLRRQQYKAYNCVADDCLPHNTCVPHTDITAAFDTAPYCRGVQHKVGAFVFRDWWSLRNKWEYDLKQLCEGVAKGTILPPVEG